MNNAVKKILLCTLLAGLSAPSLAVNVAQPNISRVNVDQSILNTVTTQLPESKAVNAAFLNTDFDPFLTLNQTANVSVTFLDEGAGYRNSLGWMSFSDQTFDGLTKGAIDLNTDNRISLSEIGEINGVDYGWLFTDVSKQGGGGSLRAGDTVSVGDGAFSAGDTISFFLGQNSAVSGGVNNNLFSGKDQVFYGLDFLNPEADFTSMIDSSLVKSRHVAMMFADENQDQVIMGFEDLNRINSQVNDWNIRSDEDFNDAVFIVNADPEIAFRSSNIATAPLSSMSETTLGWLSTLVLLVFIYPSDLKILVSGLSQHSQCKAY